jgi:hypothetical protein
MTCSPTSFVWTALPPIRRAGRSVAPAGGPALTEPATARLGDVFAEWRASLVRGNDLKMNMIGRLG